jgi:hypothetical protein
MGTFAAGLPLLAGGPPGWLAYAALGLGTLVVGGAIYMSSSKSETTTSSRTTARTEADCVRCRTWSVRTHAQGIDMGGTTGSTLGAPPVVLSQPISALTGAANANTTYALLTPSQARIRADAFTRALKWLSERPANGGYLGQKSFEVNGVRGGIRFDIDSFGPSNNFIY